MEEYTDEQEMESMVIDYEKERHQRMVFGENQGRGYDEKYFLDDKSWDVYMIKK